MGPEGGALVQRGRRKLYFDHRDMDFYFGWVLGREIYEGSDREECFDVASRIPNGDIPAWRREWLDLAKRVEDRAQAAMLEGDSEGARKAYLRACTYYRAPMFIMSPKAPQFREHWRKMHDCFRKAVPLFDPPIEAVEVPFQGRQLAGYLWKVDGSEERRPTILLIGGMETFAEDCYFILGRSAAERGYNVLTVDVPGQGVNPDRGLFLEAKMQVPLRSVVDYTLTRPEIDPDRLALHGISWGGHIVFKAAEYDQRLKAMIANPPMPDLFRAAWAQQKGHKRGDPVGRAVFDQMTWRFGLKLSPNPVDIWKRMVKAYQYYVYGKTDLSRVRCPVLCMAGEGEAKITLDIARETIAKLPNPRSKLRIFTAEEEGDAHCQVDNLALPNGVMFDWLEDLFGRTGAPQA
jgi:pimeloyl-ACP methyl ester carboxylesterase